MTDAALPHATTTKTIDFMFDFASPNAYYALRVLPEIVARTGASLNLIPCLLGGVFNATGNQAPMLAFAGIKGKMAYEMLESERFVKKYGLTAFRMNPHFPVNSLLAMRGLIAAEMDGDKDIYVEAVLRGFWEDGLKMDDPAVWTEVVNKAGLNGAALLLRTQDAEVKGKLAANTEAAVARGVFGIPTFFVGDEMFFGKERLGQVEEAAG
jgi:2-hydroxychromene-2-carboxylate isomerase